MTKLPLPCKELNILAKWLLAVMVGNKIQQSLQLIIKCSVNEPWKIGA